MFDYTELKALIREKYGSQEKFADELGLSYIEVSFKLNGRRSFTNCDIYRWQKLLDIPNRCVYRYFFKLRV